MAFNDRLKEARLAAKMTQKQLAEALGIGSTTVTGYEKGNSEPSLYIIGKIMEILHVDANFLWQDEMNDTGEISSKPTYDEMEHIRKYRSLDDYGKKAVDMVLDNELFRARKQNVITRSDNEPYTPEVLAASRPNKEMTKTDKKDLQSVLELVERTNREKKQSSNQYDISERER